MDFDERTDQDSEARMYRTHPNDKADSQASKIYRQKMRNRSAGMEVVPYIVPLLLRSIWADYKVRFARNAKRKFCPFSGGLQL